MVRPAPLVAVFVLVSLIASAAVAQTTPAPTAVPTPQTVPAADVAAPAMTAAPDATDPFLWLEDVNGARSRAWVDAENKKTLGVLKDDPRFAQLDREALAIDEANDRIPPPAIHNGRVYNFWKDAQHVRGIWRTTSIADYTRARPAWKTVLDVDALAKREGKNWFWAGSDCDSPSGKRCLVALSEGGEDATTVREFDLDRQAFVAGGFMLPHGKQSFTWEDDDHLLVAREWLPGELTASGYAYVLKRLARGAALANAVEIFRGTKSDVAVRASSDFDHRGHRVVSINRGVSFFENETLLLTPAGPKKLNIPLKAFLGELIDGRMLIQLAQPWSAGGVDVPSGALVSVDLAAALADPANLHPTIIYAPSSRETLEAATATRDHLVLSVYNNVKGRALIATPTGRNGWALRRMAFPDNSSIGVAGADRDGTTAFMYLSSYLTPPSLLLADTATGTTRIVKSQAAKFDASRDVVEQHFATSTDGTQIPYFLVRPKAMRRDGTTPTILYGYGGFQVSLTPAYSGVRGKLWLERGGAFVVANIRGGGEFGPAWHDAGLKTHRQRIYDDFAAVARDLIATNVTSPRRLGIEGGSNGGLLMGVEFTQHPELFHAVDIEVPLLDMLRFEKIEAGASWVGEYGTVTKPDERAFLASISPYNNLKAGVAYPKPLIWTTTKDDRVGPEHARKFAAKLASLNDPYLFYEVTEGGHNSGANIQEQSFTTALSITYFTQQLMDN